ncbi:MAG TPA: SDR family oxidoreductase [Hanamia sp.]|jgi:NAD(P)-dependent dehydrogenase (short-subunit alcohol dehydrogenase family)|nr:SDR family oxidoreductase [Hanamia sp.]
MSNKIALITGGSRGLGKEMALRLSENNCYVVITYVSQKEAAEDVVKEIESKGKQAAVLQFDANNISSIKEFVNDFQKIIGKKWKASKFDFLINNAGIGATIPFEKATEKEFDRFMNIHFKSVYFLTQQLLPLINDQGRIINISSGTTLYFVPGYSIYASMKGAIETFTRYLAKEVGNRGITANVVAPGPVETDFNNGGNRDNPERKKMLASRAALGRVGVAKDIGGVIAFLCSEDGGWISGQRIEVSGGMNL